MSAPGFYTRGIKFELPHPEIPVRLILIVHAVVERGLQLLRETPPDGFALDTAVEDDITFQLHWIIANRLRKSKEVPGFEKRIFGNVWREPKVTNFDGKHPDKMPDLVFDLKRDSLPILPSHDGLALECKPVDKKHSAGVDYCDKGLRRFINGDYAWTMQEAMMVAYARDGRCITDNLLPAMANRAKQLGVVEELRPARQSHDEGEMERLQVSLHSRKFPWPGDRGTACKIRIYHSWHPCP
jgi:hypothetical protein